MQVYVDSSHDPKNSDLTESKKRKRLNPKLNKLPCEHVAFKVLYAHSIDPGGPTERQQRLIRAMLANV